MWIIIKINISSFIIVLQKILFRTSIPNMPLICLYSNHTISHIAHHITTQWSTIMTESASVRVKTCDFTTKTPPHFNQNIITWVSDHKTGQQIILNPPALHVPHPLTDGGKRFRCKSTKHSYDEQPRWNTVRIVGQPVVGVHLRGRVSYDLNA